MESVDRFQHLHRLFLSHKYPVPLTKISETLECTPKTAKRIIHKMRDFYDAPIEYNRKGWYYDLKADEKFELPGLWLTAYELQALASILSLLSSMNEGLLGEEITIIEHQISKLLEARGIKLGAFSKRIKFLPIAKQFFKSKIFAKVCEGLLQRKQLKITYRAANGQSSIREVSPQTLAYYRDNWYIDCWCHLRCELRTFTLPRIIQIEVSKTKAKAISQAELKSHFTSSYGIFAGKARHMAKLKFYPTIAPQVASQQWHPEQTSEWLDNHYILSFPYGDDRELILDILKHGNNVEVLAPAKLKNNVIARLKGALELYKE